MKLKFNSPNVIGAKGKIWNFFWASLVAQMVKCLPAVWETRVQALGWEDPLEKEMATHSSTFAWKIPWTEEPSRLQSMGWQRVGHNWATSLQELFGIVCLSYTLNWQNVVCPSYLNKAGEKKKRE